MKSRKQTEAYAILSINQVRQLLALAEADAKERYEKIGGTSHFLECATVILRGYSVKIDGKTQCHLDTALGQKLTY